MAEPKAPTSTSRAGDVARILGGVVVVAAVVGIGLWAERATDDDLALPDQVVGITANDSAEARALAESTSDRLSDAYDGADADAALFGPDSKLGMLVTAVRAESTAPVPGVLTENHELVEDGAVTCLVTEAKNGPGATLCQRSGRDLTVRVSVQGRPHLEVLVEATNDVWEDLS